MLPSPFHQRQRTTKSHIPIYPEGTQMITTETTYGAEFSHAEQMDGVLAYINGADYTDAQTDAVAGALFDAFRDEVDQLLPEDIFWSPNTSAFLHPVGADVPGVDDMRDLFRQAWQAVEARYEEIEAAALEDSDKAA